MKVHLFRVSHDRDTQPLESLLRRIRRDVLTDRLRTVGRAEVRVEEVEQRGHLWFVDFCRLRFNHGPGRAAREEPVEGFDFAPGQCFAEETGMAFDPQSRFAVIQYNHFGVRSGTIEQYFSSYDEGRTDAYDLEVKLDSDAERRLARKAKFTKATVKLSLDRMRAADRASGMPLYQAIRLGREFNAVEVAVQITAARSRQAPGLDEGLVRSTIEWVQQHLNADPESVSSAKFYGRDDPEGKSELVDLIKDRLSHEFTDVRAGPDLRLARGDRWNLLQRAFRRWDGIIRAG